MRKNQKGFLIALCLCMLSISGIFGVYQYQKGSAPEPKTEVPGQNSQVAERPEPEKEAANSSGTVAQADTEEEEAEQAKIDTEEDIYKIGEAELARTEDAPAEEIIAEGEPEQEAPTDEETEEESVETVGETGELAFSESSRILWPVDGDVILNYSMDKTVYFPTLQQYKYNPAIVIAANKGDSITAAADGRVVSVSYDPAIGNTVVMDLGNGYELTYGQLENITVSEGSYVSVGDGIGTVAAPTKYYSVEGTNVYFKLTKDGEPVNPMGQLN